MKYTFEIEINENGKVIMLESFNEYGSHCGFVDCKNWGDEPITIKEAAKLIEEEIS